MKFSTNYLLYPENKALERSIAHALALLSTEAAAAAAPDTKAAVADNFRYTRGNYEQHRFSSRIFESLLEALELSLTDQFHEQQPLAWAQTQNNMGNILAAQGQQRRDAQSFERGVQCFNTALEEFKQEFSPLECPAPDWPCPGCIA